MGYLTSISTSSRLFFFYFSGGRNKPETLFTCFSYWTHWCVTNEQGVWDAKLFWSVRLKFWSKIGNVLHWSSDSVLAFQFLTQCSCLGMLFAFISYILILVSSLCCIVRVLSMHYNIAKQSYIPWLGVWKWTHCSYSQRPMRVLWWSNTVQRLPLRTAWTYWDMLSDLWNWLEKCSKSVGF